MAQFEQYENLPGVKVSYEDGNLHTGQQAGGANTQSVLIIGTAIDGPVGEPISVNAIGGPKAADKMFGGILQRVKITENGEERVVKVPHEGSLVRSMWEIVRSGNEDVRLLRVTGKGAKTELPIQDTESEINQRLSDTSGDNLIPGNIAFHKEIPLGSDLRLVKIEKIEEFESNDTTGAPVRVYPDTTGYQTIETTPGEEAIYFLKDKYRPKNTIKITYQARKRTYTEVTRNMNGTDNPETKGLLIQDPANKNYFAAEVGSWSDDPIHTVNVYVIDTNGDVNAIPSTNTNGKFLWRIGESDPSVTDELTDITTPEEFRQGGVRFTSAYQEEVEKGLYPSLDSGITVLADYFYYSDQEVQGTVEAIVPGTEKGTTLNYMPISGTLEVYYEHDGQKNVLKEGEDYSIIFPDIEGQKISIRIKAGVGPVGAKLFAHYMTGEGNSEDAVLIVNAIHPGKLYGGIENPNEPESLFGVKVVVEYETFPNGTVDMDNRIIRFIKPIEKRETSTDIELRFSTKNLRGIRTLREFANYVNALPSNNIIRLEVPIDAGETSLSKLRVTDHTIGMSNGNYYYRPINLGEKFDANEMKFKLYIDDSKEENSPDRYPWLGSDGFLDNRNIKDMKDLYERLGGKYELAHESLNEFDLVEQGIYSQLENYAVDVIVLKDVYANTVIGELSEDNKIIPSRTLSFATQLAQHCAIVTAKTRETISAIALAPAPRSGLREVQEYIDLLTLDIPVTEEMEDFYFSRGINPHYKNNLHLYNLATGELIYNEEGEPIDIGPYINSVYGPEVGMSHEKLGNYISSGDVLYASLISQLPAEVATTNKTIAAAGLRYNLSEAQHNQLAGGRFVTFEHKLNVGRRSGVVVKDGVTSAKRDSDYQRLSTVRIVHTTVQLIRSAADKFIGLPNGIAQRNSLATEIQAVLDKLKDMGVLQNFKFSIYSSARDQVLGNAFIQLELVPAYELRKIYTSVALRASL